MGRGKVGRDRASARFHGRVEGADRPCGHPGCDEAGEFRAPPDGAGPHDGPPRFRWFCLDHVRAFNAGYNYFQGMSAEEIHRAQSPTAGWERETRAFARAGSDDQAPRWSDFSDPLDAITARYRRTPASGNNDGGKNGGRPLSDEERRNMGVLGLAPGADRSALRKRYSELVRRYHPDRNGGDRSHEARLAEVIAAYQQLRRAPAFL